MYNLQPDPHVSFFQFGCKGCSTCGYLNAAYAFRCGAQWCGSFLGVSSTTLQEAAKQGIKICPNCGDWYSSWARFCKRCACPLQDATYALPVPPPNPNQEEVPCPKCSKTKLQTPFCDYCGRLVAVRIKIIETLSLSQHIINLQLGYGNAVIYCPVLLDSGASTSLFHGYIAGMLGINLSYAPISPISGITPGFGTAYAGQNYLKEQGFSGFSRLRKSEIAEMTYPHLQHALDLNDVLITAKLLTRSVPEITLVAMQHDLDLKKTPAKFTYLRRLSDGGKIEESATIVPDAWLDFRLKLPGAQKQRRKCIVFELDRGTTSMTPFKQKLRAYVHYAAEDGSYYHQFGTNTISIAYATTAGHERLSMMRSWCEDELTQQRLDHEAALFCFTALSRELDARTIFCEACWYVPYEQEPVTLLWNI